MPSDPTKELANNAFINTGYSPTLHLHTPSPEIFLFGREVVMENSLRMERLPDLKKGHNKDERNDSGYFLWGKDACLLLLQIIIYRQNRKFDPTDKTTNKMGLTIQ